MIRRSLAVLAGALALQAVLPQPVLLAAPAAARLDEKEKIVLDEVEVTVDLTGLGMRAVRVESIDEPGAQLRHRITGRLEKTSVLVELFVYPNAELGVAIPEHLIWVAESHRDRLAREERGTTTEAAEPWSFDREHFRIGPYGYVPYAIVGEKLADEGSDEPQGYLCMAGVTREKSYSVEVHTRPPLDAAVCEKVLEALFAGVRYGGDTYEREWTEEETVERWEREAPDDLAEDLEVLRTEHFIILTNSSGKKKFASELEKSYDRIMELYPFEEMEELRLLPIFLFRTNEQYYAFCVKTLGMDAGEARRTKGVASGDLYATWYEAPKDPVHIHELTHQIFRNRLRLSGGGSWFQEGVAEYICTRENERKRFRNVVKNERNVPLAKFIGTPSLIAAGEGQKRVDGTSAADEAYLQAACLIEYVKEEREFRGKFLDFVHGVGSARRNDLAAIEAVLKDVLGVDLATFEAGFLEYWRKR